MTNKDKVVILDVQNENQMEIWKRLSEEYNLEILAPMTNDHHELKKLLFDAKVLITQNQKIDNKILDLAPDAIFIQKMGGRLDNVDLKAVKAKGIRISAISLPGSVAVAEHAMMLVLACAKKVIVGHKMTVNGEYRDLGIEPKLTTQASHGFQWMKIPDLEELNGLTMGIFGFGDIGNEIAKRASSFNMKIIYHKRHPLDSQMEELLKVRYVSKEDLFRESDFLVMISPLTSETEKAAGANEFRLMKPSAYFINCCRGGVVDEKALYEALKNHQIAGAGLDVFLYEPVQWDHPLLTLNNVTLTPHIAEEKVEQP